MTIATAPEYPVSLNVVFPTFPLPVAFEDRESVYSSSLLRAPRHSESSGGSAGSVMDYDEAEIRVLSRILEKGTSHLTWRYRFVHCQIL